MLVTTSINPSTFLEKRAQKLAIELSGLYTNRNALTLSRLQKSFNDFEILVVSDTDIKFYSKNNQLLFFHPSLAKIRITTDLKVCQDRLLRVSDIKKGDQILDCTMGLGTDSIILSYGAGSTGKVVALESSSLLSVIVKDGLKKINSKIDVLNQSAKRINVINVEHLTYLKSLPDKSFDMVYFDPMFRQPTKSVALDTFRHLANNSPLQIESIKQATRVAKKCVVLKEQPSSGEFQRLGFEIDGFNSNSRFEYGSIRKL